MMVPQTMKPYLHGPRSRDLEFSGPKHRDMMTKKRHRSCQFKTKKNTASSVIVSIWSNNGGYDYKKKIIKI